MGNRFISKIEIRDHLRSKEHQILGRWVKFQRPINFLIVLRILSFLKAFNRGVGWALAWALGPSAEWRGGLAVEKSKIFKILRFFQKVAKSHKNVGKVVWSGF